MEALRSLAMQGSINTFRKGVPDVVSDYHRCDRHQDQDGFVGSRVAVRSVAIRSGRPIRLGKNIFPLDAATLARPGRLLRRGVPINTARTCARAPAHVRAGPVVSALGSQGKCAVVTGHLRARLVAGKTAFLDARSAQRVGWKELVCPHDTRNSCPTIDFAITRFSTTTCNRRPGPLLDVWRGFWGPPAGPVFGLTCSSIPC